MSLYKKVKAVEQLFKSVDKDLEKFRAKTGMKCLSGCGQCCTRPFIEATILEFLPFAYYLYKSDEAFNWMEMLENDKDAKICKNLAGMIPNGSSGFCQNYTYRGLICRLFGFSAVMDKHGKPVLSTCGVIKNNFPETYQETLKMIEEGAFVPVMKNYHSRLQTIDYSLTEKMYPINIAILEAIKLVLSHYAYQPNKPRKFKLAS